MRLKRIRGKGVLAVIVCLMLVLGFSTFANAEADWPTRTITVYNHFPPGGATDITARRLTADMEPFLGVTINNVNMPGATGGVANTYVMEQEMDGYSWIGKSDNTRMHQTMGLSDYGYEEFHYWLPVAGPNIVGTHVDSEIEDIDHLVELLKDDEIEITAAVCGMGSGTHTPIEYLADAVGGSVNAIIYDGGADAATATVRGETDIGNAVTSTASEFVRSGDFVPLAVFDVEPLETEMFGEVPPVTEVAPELEPYLPLGGWWGIAVPRDVPDYVVEAIDEAYEKAIHTEEFEQFAEDQMLTLTRWSREESFEQAEMDTKVVSWLLYDLGEAEYSPEEFGIERP